MSTRWIIVSNRLPYQFDSHQQQIVLSAGGLVTAITGIHSDIEKLWVGTCAENEVDLFQDSSHSLPMPCLPVPVTAEDYDLYYNGFCNDVLWPLFHYQSDRVLFSQSTWQAYQRVNESIANHIIEHAQEGDMIWIHDFQLCLVPQLIKARTPELNVGFFLHIPFPSSEIFSELPVRKNILRGLLSADLIGFQDYAYLKHFCHTVQRIFGVETNLFHINYEGRNAALGVFPVSIDVEKFHETANQKNIIKQANTYQTTEFVLLGVDRLDYIKGVDLKFKAYAAFLEKFPEYHGRVTLIQVAIPTRQDVEEYKRLRATVEQLISGINGQYATPTWTPIHYLYHPVSFEELLSLYRAADILLVTSKRDGMNLVSLEYLAAQPLSDPGVVLLSEFTGANSLLSHAVMINPWDTEETAEKLHQALSFNKERRVADHLVMYNFLENYSATDWANRFMNRLQQVYLESETKNAKEIRELSDFLDGYLLEASVEDPLIIFIDYDGTLVKLEQHPQDAVLPKESYQLLKQLSEMPNLDVVVITGREKEFIAKQLEGLSVNIGAEHGAMFYDKHRERWQNLTISDQTQWYDSTLKIMEDYMRQVPGSFVEQKDFCLCWHYRNSPGRFAQYQALKISEELENGLAHLPARIIRGKKVVEVCAVEANKGIFVHWYLDVHEAHCQVMALGDDRTDEDVFYELARFQALTIKVGPGVTAARYRLKSQSDVARCLEQIISSFKRKKIRKKY